MSRKYMNYNHNDQRKYSVYTAAAVIDNANIMCNIIQTNVDLNLQTINPVCHRPKFHSLGVYLILSRIGVYVTNNNGFWI
jgi:hypothetical protein